VPATPLLSGGPGRRRLLVYPGGCRDGRGTHLSVFLEAQDAIWSPSAKYTLHVVNQADASKSFSHSECTGQPCEGRVWTHCRQFEPEPEPIRFRVTACTTCKFCDEEHGWGAQELIALSALSDAASGFLANDTLVLSVDVTVEREDRFQLDTGAKQTGGCQAVSYACHAHACVCCTPQVACLAT
jgi:hypothetical protein